eukprot:6405103-Amphidinium_carterae.1
MSQGTCLIRERGCATRSRVDLKTLARHIILACNVTKTSTAIAPFGRFRPHFCDTCCYHEQNAQKNGSNCTITVLGKF